MRFRRKLLTEHLVGKLLEAGAMSLNEALCEVRRFEQQPELVIITQRR